MVDLLAQSEAFCLGVAQPVPEKLDFLLLPRAQLRRESDLPAGVFELCARATEQRLERRGARPVEAARRRWIDPRLPGPIGA